MVPPGIFAKNETISSAMASSATMMAPKLWIAMPTDPVTPSPRSSATCDVNEPPSSTHLNNPKTHSAIAAAWMATKPAMLCARAL